MCACACGQQNGMLQRSKAAEQALLDFEALFKAVFFAPSSTATVKKGDEEAGVDAGAEAGEIEPPVVKYRKSQRFFHCKAPKNLVHVGQLLQKLMKHVVWNTLSDKLAAEDARNVANPMDLAMVRANLELGLYASADMCVADIRLALANARAVGRDQSQATIMEHQSLKFLQDDFERELLQGKMFAAVFGYGETRQDLPLSTPAFSQLAKELVDRVIERPDSEPFHKPVRPIEDGCAGVGACVSLCQVSSSWRFQNVCPPPDLHHSHLGIALLVKCVCVLCRWSGFVRVIVRRGGVAGRSKCRVLCRLR